MHTSQTLRRKVGRELDIVLAGTATSVPGSTAGLADISGDSPLDPSDPDSRFDGAGLLIRHANGNLYYRRNIDFLPASQELRFVALPGLAGTPDYELHLEPQLHPLTIWPDLINEGLAYIRHIVRRPIMFATGRNHYDLADYPEITGPEQVRALAYRGENLLLNPDFNEWTGDVPGEWTRSAGTSEREAGATLNYPYACRFSGSLHQEVDVISDDATVRAYAFFAEAAAARSSLVLEALASDGAVLKTAQADRPSGSGARTVTAALSLADDIERVRVKLESSGGESVVFAPMIHYHDMGISRDIPQFRVEEAIGGGLSMYSSSGRFGEGVGELALLLPYEKLAGQFDLAATDDLVLGNPDPPTDRLLEAAVAVEVLNWLVRNPTLAARIEYASALRSWSDKRDDREEEYSRRIEKTAEMYPAGDESPWPVVGPMYEGG